jgi:ubiquitin C-terminal hydrolase
MNKYKNKGLSGLANLGNTCYINSFIQVLSHTYELNDFLDSEEFDNRIDKDKGTMLIEWNNLRKLLWKENCGIAPWGFLKTIQKIAKEKDREIFTGYMQNDLPEFILFILDCFHIGLEREVIMSINGEIKNDNDKLAKDCYSIIIDMYKKEYSEILYLFYGISVTQISNMENTVLVNKPEPYSIISLSIPKKDCNIYECFDRYCENELICGENAWFNEKTNKKEDVNKKTLFWSFPDILIIDLKRFTNNNKKINYLVDYPIYNLMLEKYVIGYKKNSYVYDLYGICNHSGMTNGGHYFAYVKNANGKWYIFNDTVVKEINVNDLITNKAYSLFYRKKK